MFQKRRKRLSLFRRESRRILKNDSGERPQIRLSIRQERYGVRRNIQFQRRQRLLYDGSPSCRDRLFRSIGDDRERARRPLRKHGGGIIRRDSIRSFEPSGKAIVVPFGKVKSRLARRLPLCAGDDLLVLNDHDFARERR